MSEELAIVPPLDTQRLAGLVFELAAQLHAERSRRMALEHALQSCGVLERDAVPAAAADVDCAQRSREAVEESVARLVRVITEGSDPQTPLRERASGAGKGGN